MDMFNAKDRRHPKMDDYMDIKKPSFGGPKSGKDLDKSKPEFLKGYRRTIERNKDFEMGGHNPNYDTTWKAITNDVVHKQEGKKPFDPMHKAKSEKIEEGRILRYNEFLNENFEDMLNDDPENNEMPMGDEGAEHSEEPQLDEEKLEALKEEYMEKIAKMISEIAEKMEMEKEELCPYFCAVAEEACMAKEEEEENNEEGNEEEEEEENDDK